METRMSDGTTLANSNDRLNDDPRDVRIACRFLATLIAATLLLPPSGLLWLPGAVHIVTSWITAAL